MMKNFYLLFYASAFYALLVNDCKCDKDVEFATTWDEKMGAQGNQEEKNWTESVDRSLNLKPSESNVASKGVLDATVQNMNEESNQKKKTTDSAVKEDNIQRMAKKMNFLISRIAEEEKVESAFLYSNASRSDVVWLASILNVAVWDPERIPGVERVSSGCGSHFRQYLKDLHKGTLWATKGCGN